MELTADVFFNDDNAEATKAAIVVAIQNKYPQLVDDSIVVMFKLLDVLAGDVLGMSKEEARQAMSSICTLATNPGGEPTFDNIVAAELATDAPNATPLLIAATIEFMINDQFSGLDLSTDEKDNLMTELKDFCIALSSTASRRRTLEFSFEEAHRVVVTFPQSATQNDTSPEMDDCAVIAGALGCSERVFVVEGPVASSMPPTVHTVVPRMGATESGLGGAEIAGIIVGILVVLLVAAGLIFRSLRSGGTHEAVPITSDTEAEALQEPYQAADEYM